jgi:hypothetical protein
MAAVRRIGHIRHDGGVVTGAPDPTSSVCPCSAPGSTYIPAQAPAQKPWPATSTPTSAAGADGRYTANTPVHNQLIRA